MRLLLDWGMVTAVFNICYFLVMDLGSSFHSALPGWRRSIAGLAIVALACKLALAWCTAGTNDMRTWEADLQVITAEGGSAVYKEFVPIYESGMVTHTQVFNHPPMMISVLRVWGWLADQTGVPFRFWLRATSSLADLGTLALLYLAASRGVWRIGGPALCVLAASPVAIFVSGFHGNTDPILTFLIVGSAFLIEGGDHVAGSGLLLGLAMEIKIVPLLLVPAILLMLPSYRQRVIWCASAACTALLPAVPYWLVARGMLKNIFGYGSDAGVWGFSYLHGALHLPHPYGFNLALKWVMLGSIVAVAVWYSLRPYPVNLFHRWGTTMFLLLGAAPGFGIQYLAWLSPWPAAIGLRAMVLYHATSGLFVAVVYTLWSGGIPWDYANAYRTSWYGWMHVPHLMAWVTIVATTLVFLFTGSLFARQPSESMQRLAFRAIR